MSQPKIDWLAMPGALPDVLSSDGNYVYMRHLAFGLDGKPADHPGNDHLYCPTGFLDRSSFHRSFWNYGKGSFKSRIGVGTGAGPGSKIIVMDKDNLFHFGRSRAVTAMMRSDERFFLSSTSRSSPDAQATKAKRRRGRDTERGDSPAAAATRHWAVASPVQVHAMVLSNDTLFIAGPKGDWMHSADAYEGREGIALVVVSASTGTASAEYTLPAFPVFDGMSAAYESLYLSLLDGSVVRFAGQ